MENFLLDEAGLLTATSELTATKCPYASVSDVTDALRALLLDDGHLLPFTKAILDARVASLAKQAWDAVYSQSTFNAAPVTFATVQQEARTLLTQAGVDGTWKAKCKGRDLLKAFCKKHGFKYEHFRNLLISRMKEPPKELKSIMDKILAA